jgi:transcriptional regulator with GAF, ATPase, and Fis domain
VQCGAIPETLLDSELFGHEKGAFTGATAQKRGRFERAGQGTIFLDEIAELSPEAQVKLLRVLQEREFERVGGTQTLHTNVRVIAATHRNLEAMCQAGSFREDLWFRLNVFPIRIPPLRDRRQDIPALVQYFIERKSREMNLATIPAPAPGVIEGLMDYHWPGNVRELQNIIERALILSPGKPLQIAPLSNQAGPIAEQDLCETGHIQSLDEVSVHHIRYVMSRTNGRIEGPGGAAELLQINPGTLRSRMRKLGIPFGRKAEPYQQR